MTASSQTYPTQDLSRPNHLRHSRAGGNPSGSPLAHGLRLGLEACSNLLKFSANTEFTETRVVPGLRRDDDGGNGFDQRPKLAGFRQLPILAAALLLFGFASIIGHHPAAAQDKGAGLLEKVKASITNINTEQVKAALAADPNTVVIDVRTLRETNLTGGIIRAKRNHVIPRGWLEFRIEDAVPDKNTPVILYCGTNRRSPLATHQMQQMGYKNVKNYTDGFFAWKKAGLPIESADKAPDSFLYSMPVKVADGVYSAIGATAPSTYQNAGHNNNLSFVIGDDAVLVFNAGGSYMLARSIHDEIKKLTDKPVKYVVLENAQGHAALGTDYWQSQGVPVYIHEDAMHEWKEKSFQILQSAKRRLRDKAYLTKIATPKETFGAKKLFDLGGLTVEILNLGPAHSPGDSVAWIPARSVVISGDMAFHERLLPVFEHTHTAEWIKTWDKFAALGAKHVIPGHGAPTNIAEVEKYTKGYLVHMRREIQKVLDNGGDLIAAYDIDQSAYEHLDTFEFLARRNVGVIYRAMEFE